MQKTKLLCIPKISIFIFNIRFYIIAAGNLSCFSSINSCAQKQRAWNYLLWFGKFLVINLFSGSQQTFRVRI